MFLLCFSASYDTTVKLWELERGSCVLSLSKHQEAVHSLSFSPDGRYIASGSFDRALNVWSTQVGNIFTLFPIIFPNQICNSPYYQPYNTYNSYNVSSENLALDQLIIPKFTFLFILITYLVDIVLIL